MRIYPKRETLKIESDLENEDGLILDFLSIYDKNENLLDQTNGEIGSIINLVHEGIEYISYPDRKDILVTYQSLINKFDN